MKNIDVAYTADLSLLSKDAIASLYEGVGFGTTEDYDMHDNLPDIIFGPNIHGFFAFEKTTNKLIGMIRVFSDDTYVSWIAEIVVLPDWQRNGIGSNLLQMVIERLGHTSIYTCTLEKTTMFFNKHGISPKEKLVSCSRR